MNTPIHAVLFDLDDTLLDSWAARVAALHAVFTEAGIREPTAHDFIHEMRGRQFQHAIAPLQERVGLRVNLFDAYRRAYWRQPAGLVRLFPGVDALVRRLHGRGLKLGVVTQKERTFEADGRPVGAAWELAQTGLAAMFSAVIGYEDVTHHKPHPEAVHRAMETLGASPQETLVIGDSAADISAALSAGCWACHATWGQPDGAPALNGLRPHLTARRPREVLDGLARP